MIVLRNLQFKGAEIARAVRITGVDFLSCSQDMIVCEYNEDEKTITIGTMGCEAIRKEKFKLLVEDILYPYDLDKREFSVQVFDVEDNLIAESSGKYKAAGILLSASVKAALNNHCSAYALNIEISPPIDIEEKSRIKVALPVELNYVPSGNGVSEFISCIDWSAKEILLETKIRYEADTTFNLTIENIETPYKNASYDIKVKLYSNREPFYEYLIYDKNFVSMTMNSARYLEGTATVDSSTLVVMEPNSYTITFNIPCAVPHAFVYFITPPAGFTGSCLQECELQDDMIKISKDGAEAGSVTLRFDLISPISAESLKNSFFIEAESSEEAIFTIDVALPDGLLLKPGTIPLFDITLDDNRINAKTTYTFKMELKNAISEEGIVEINFNPSMEFSDEIECRLNDEVNECTRKESIVRLTGISTDEKELTIAIPCTLRCYHCFPCTLRLSLIHICRCRRYAVCRSRWSPYH
eukprot:TRINITY_DN7381_c0_g1_i3.p1 TRINITY_DN7381_c0_g1~~TRINITY_DN7381_c0_g1_i3.p1  ORF type:complete len:470 (-),score=48.10 TRINITY_DN7381_c0_g1_i3:22-1431(-)